MEERLDFIGADVSVRATRSYPPRVILEPNYSLSVQAQQGRSSVIVKTPGIHSTPVSVSIPAPVSAPASDPNPKGGVYEERLYLDQRDELEYQAECPETEETNCYYIRSYYVPLEINTEPNYSSQQEDIKSHRPEMQNHQLKVQNHQPELHNHLQDLRNDQPYMQNHLSELQNHQLELQDYQIERQHHSNELRDSQPELQNHPKLQSLQACKSSRGIQKRPQSRTALRDADAHARRQKKLAQERSDDLHGDVEVERMILPDLVDPLDSSSEDTDITERWLASVI